MDAHGYSTIRLGAPAPTISARAEILRLEAAGYGSTVIARSLNVRGVPTPTGRGRWWPETVRRHVHPEPWAAYQRSYRRRGAGSGISTTTTRSTPPRPTPAKAPASFNRSAATTGEKGSPGT